MTDDKSSDPSRTAIESLAAALPEPASWFSQDHEHVADVLDPEDLPLRIVRSYRTAAEDRGLPQSVCS